MTDRTVVYRLRAESSQLKAEMASASASVKKTASDMDSASKKSKEFSKGLDTLGGAAGKVGLVAAVGLGAAIVKAADFDEAMSQVQAATHESASAMESLRAAALQAGADTAFSATEAAAGIENLAKAGISTADILDGGLAGALDLAAAGGMEVADAAEAAAGAMAQFKLDGDQATHVADLLAAGAGKAQGDVSDMVMALKQAGTVSAQTGLSIEETTGTLAAMAEQSLLGSDAGTSFKTMLASLTPNSEKARKAMEQYNIHAFDAQGNFVGMTELAGQLRTGLGSLTDEQRAMTLETIFGSDAVRAAAIVYDNGAEGIQGWIDKTDDAGYAAETAGIKLDNLKGDLEALGGSLETALIGTGDGSQGMLRGLTQSLTDTVNAYNDLGEGAKSGVAVTLGATAALGGGLFVFSKMVRGIAATRVAMDQLGISAAGTKGSLAAVGRAAGPVLAVTAAVTALGNAIAEANGAILNSSDLQRNVEALSMGSGDEVLDRIVKDLEIANQLTSDLSEPIKEVFTGFGLIGNTNLDNVKDNLTQMDEALAGLVESGDGEKAAEVFERIMEASDLDDSEVNEYFDSYLLALENTAAGADDHATAVDNAAEAEAAHAEAVALSVEQLEAQEEALKDAREAATETAQGFFNLGDSLNDASVSLGDWITEMANQADALNNFTENAKKAGKRGLRDGLIRDLEAAGTEGALRLKQLANASDAEIARANKAWLKGQRAIDDYVDATTKVPKKVSTKVDVDALPAFATFRQVDQFMTDLDGRRVTTYIDTVRTVTGRRGAAAFSQEAYGDVKDRHDPEIAEGGSWRVWAEPETMGESYIPHANDSRRPRARRILEETAAILGARSVEWYAGGGTSESAAARRDRERREEARRRAEERRRREEERRQRRLDKQRTKALLSSDLSDDSEQAALEVADARRRLRSAKKADRPASEVLDAKLALKQERADQRAQQKQDNEERARAAQDAEEERQRIAQEAEDERIRIAEEAAARQREIDDAILDGQTRAWDQATDAARSQVDAAKAMVDSVQANMDRIAQAATSAFSGSWFTGDREHGLWTGSGSAGDWKSRASGDIASLQERSALISQLSILGLSGAALEDLLGNQSNAGISAMISAGEIDDFAALFAQRQQLLESVGAQAGQAGYGTDMAAANAELVLANQKLDLLTAIIAAARPITVTETISAAAMVAEIARLQAAAGGF